MTPRNEPGHPVVVPEEIWALWERRHTAAVDELTAAHLDRRRRGEAHPVVDFLFTYYRTSVATVRRWHPGPGLLLENAHHTRRVDWRHYRRESVNGRSGLVVDETSVLDRCGPRIARARDIIGATLDRPGATGCFGLHEWAMLYGTGPDEIRHGTVPLRVSHERIDDVVRGSQLRCTHFDAFRFFTDEAAPLNQTRLSRKQQVATEQPGCLHAGMDVYSWVASMEAGAPGELLVDALLAAFDAREVDMRSSPYDLSAWGLDPIPVETAEGRAAFVAFQKDWIQRTHVLRRRFLDAADRLHTPVAPYTGSGASPADPQAGTAPNVRTATSATTRPNSP